MFLILKKKTTVLLKVKRERKCQEILYYKPDFLQVKLFIKHIRFSCEIQK